MSSGHDCSSKCIALADEHNHGQQFGSYTEPQSVQQEEQLTAGNHGNKNGQQNMDLSNPDYPCRQTKSIYKSLSIGKQ